MECFLIIERHQHRLSANLNCQLAPKSPYIKELGGGFYSQRFNCQQVESQTVSCTHFGCLFGSRSFPPSPIIIYKNNEIRGFIFNQLILNGIVVPFFELCECGIFSSKCFLSKKSTCCLILYQNSC